jgi:hypothetical protein
MGETEGDWFFQIDLPYDPGSYVPALGTFSQFRWEGGYWHPILLCLFGGGLSGLTVFFFNGIFDSLFGGNFGLVLLATAGGLLLGLLLGVGALIASLYLFSGAVLGILSVLGVRGLSYQRAFRVVAYTSVLIDLLNAISGLAICVALPKQLWDPL